MLPAVLLALLLAAPAVAATPPTLLLVLDASPSIAGEVVAAPTGVGWWRRLLTRAYGLDPRPPATADRLGVVRAAVRRYAEQLPAGSLVGVRAFGQRRWQGCKDSQLLLPLAPLDRERLDATLTRIQPSPSGKTPLAHALEEAVRDLLALPSGATPHIILFTDATDRCSDAPLPDGGSLTGAAGVSATIDIITLALSAEQAAPLVPATRGTGGHLYLAADTTTVEIALRRCLPLTPRQHLAALLRLHPGGWPVAVAAAVLLLLVIVGWLLVRSER